MRRPTGIHEVEVAGSILGPSTYLSFSLPTADLSRAVSYWRKYRHLILVNRLGSLPRYSVDMALIMLTGT